MIKHQLGHFGHCPRVYCESSVVLPCGRSDVPGIDSVRLFCPTCIDIYVPPNSRFQNIDGAYFGTTFPHLFLLSYPEFENPNSINGGLHIYQPRIYGFKISELSHVGPRQQWLRFRPKQTIERAESPEPMDEANSEQKSDRMSAMSYR